LDRNDTTGQSKKVISLKGTVENRGSICRGGAPIDINASPDRRPGKRSVPIRQLHRFFLEAFRAGDIAQALFSWDAATPAAQAHSRMTKLQFDVAGVRISGGVAGWIERDALAEGRCIEYLRAFSEALVLASEVPLSEVIVALGAHRRIFVTAFGEIGGIITRADIQKAPVRMWLFGLITLVEETFSKLLKEHFPDDSWTTQLSSARLEKARALHAERQRRNEHLDLADCLQFSDKGHVLFKNEDIRTYLGFSSRVQAKDMMKRLEKLRNNLAHSQDIVSDNLDTIVQLAAVLDRVLDLSQD